MEYNMTINNTQYIIARDESATLLCDRKDFITDHSGFELEVNNIFLDQFHINWGLYKSPTAKSYSTLTNNETIVAYFCQRGACTNDHNKHLNLKRGESILNIEKKDEYTFRMDVDKGIGQFFEVSICPVHFAELFSDDHYVIDQVFSNKPLYCNFFKDPVLAALIKDMHIRKDMYRGHMKQLYLESKVSELLLIQITNLEHQNKIRLPKLHQRDIEAIYEVKEIMDKDLVHISISHLARLAGINETKLKSGFKTLFGKTIFEYLTSTRMNKAKELLMETDLVISDIANIVGYQYSQHFITAFKRHFECTPNELRR